MGHVPPATLAALLRNADGLGPAGEFFRRAFGAFEFEGIAPTPPTETFSGEQRLQVGGKAVRLVEVGPAHTRGDVVVEVPGDAVVFWATSLRRQAPHRKEGPIATDPRLRRDLRHAARRGGAGSRAAHRRRGVVRCATTCHIRDEARRYDAGLPVREAARDISLADYASWGDAERIAVNVATLYREFGDPAPPPGPLELFGWMAELARDRRG
jgi:glyoxylase-like metal-dependent hydrolase (beta-lactamase superfamily II)